MSLAKVHRAKKARKVWTCGKCGTTVQVGEPVLSYSVGFRGREERRCDKASCYPTREELESSLVASVYGVVDNLDWLSATSVEALKDLVQEAADSMREVAGEYEASEMFEKNEDLQERAEILNSSADDLEAWEPDEDEPDREDRDTWGGHEAFEAALTDWFERTRESAQQTVEEAETP